MLNRFFALFAVGVLVFAAVGCTKSRPATRYALLAGGSGETIEPNFFVEDLKRLGSSLAARGWRVDYVVGPRAGLLPGSVEATNAHLLQGVRRTLEAAQPGQQALLVFHTHGRERETYWGQRSHSIVSEDKSAPGVDASGVGMPGAEPGFDLDSLEPEMLKAQARGVRVALIDMSCYSGSTQALKGAACTVTLASARYVSLCSGRNEERHFNSSFFALPAPGTACDLESQFLSSRRTDQDSINLPQISSRVTPAREAWEDLLSKVDPLDVFEDLKDLRTDGPRYDSKALLAAYKGAPAELRAELEAGVRELVSLRKQLEARMPRLAKDHDEATLLVQPEGRSEIKIGAAYLAEMLSALDDGGQVPDGYTDVQRRLLEALKPQRKALEARHAAVLGDFAQRREEFDRGKEALEQVAGRLFMVERALYDAASAEGGAGCRGFVL